MAKQEINLAHRLYELPSRNLMRNVTQVNQDRYIISPAPIAIALVLSAFASSQPK